MSCSKCLEDKELFYGKFCIDCFPEWWDRNKKYLKSFGCVVSGCPNQRRVFLGFCFNHAEDYWSKGGRTLHPRSKWFNPDGTRKLCSISGCEAPVHQKGVCHYHRDRSYTQNGVLRKVVKRFGSNFNPDGSRKSCAEEGCEQFSSTKGLCLPHYHKNIRREALEGGNGVNKCPVNNCGRNKRIKSPICKRCTQFAWRYSLTPEEVIQLWMTKNYVCSNPSCRNTENLHLDHSHTCCPPEKYGTSHKVSCGKCNRGWLCRSCNLALGYLQENPRVIQGLLDYLDGEGRSMIQE